MKRISCKTIGHTELRGKTACVAERSTSIIVLYSRYAHRISRTEVIVFFKLKN